MSLEFNGFLGSWGPGVGIGMLVVGGAYAAATGNLDSFAGAVAGGFAGYGAGKAIANTEKYKSMVSAHQQKAEAAKQQAGTQETISDEPNTPRKSLDNGASEKISNNQAQDLDGVRDFRNGKIAFDHCDSNGCVVYRQGKFPNGDFKGNRVIGGEWATENPLTTPDYAKGYGLPNVMPPLKQGKIKLEPAVVL